jgi:hypothetical protein
LPSPACRPLVTLILAAGQSEGGAVPSNGPTTWTVVAGSEAVMEHTEHGMMAFITVTQ